MALVMSIHTPLPIGGKAPDATGSGRHLSILARIYLWFLARRTA
jgi:hypothetical protein